LLAKRILQALEVLGGDGSVTGSLRDQATSYLGEGVDDVVLRYLDNASSAVYDDISTAARSAGYPRSLAHTSALTQVIIAGMAIGKRLGIEDGEKLLGAVKW
jgi:hypothetical protein